MHYQPDKPYMIYTWYFSRRTKLHYCKAEEPGVFGPLSRSRMKYRRSRQKYAALVPALEDKVFFTVFSLGTTYEQIYKNQSRIFWHLGIGVA